MAGARRNWNGSSVIQVALIGDGQLARGVAAALTGRADIALTGPSTRADQALLLRSGADVVVIATTTRLIDVLPAIEIAVSAGSNVIVSAEEAAYPWAVDYAAADRVHNSALAQGVSVLGCGLNPGFVFDALVVTFLGVHGPARRIEVTRTVDLSGFGPTVALRLGLGVDPLTFESRVVSGEILGHAGFAQSMNIVARATGVSLERIETSIAPIVDNNLTVGIRQDDVGVVGGAPWYRAQFIGHTAPLSAGLVTRDSIALDPGTPGELLTVIEPGIRSQAGSQAIIANSIDRVVAAPPGWLTVADLPPARPFVS